MGGSGHGTATGRAGRMAVDAAAGLLAGLFWWAVHPGVGASPLAAGLILGNAAGAVAAGLFLDLALAFTRGTPAPVGPGRISFLLGALVAAPALAIAADARLPAINLISATPSGLAALLALAVAGGSVMALVARTARRTFSRAPLRAGVIAAAVALLLGAAAAGTPQELPRRLAQVPRPAFTVERDGAALASRITIVGVDGADYSVLLPLIRAGRLPAFARFFEDGTALVCRSVRDATGEIASPVVWTSIATGCAPERHGVDGWDNAVSVNRRVPALWNVVGAAGGRSIVLNVPGTYPPDPVRGLLVSGMPLPESVLAQGPGFFFAADPAASPWARLEPGRIERAGDGWSTVRIGVPRIPDPARASRLGFSHLVVRHLIVEGLSRPSLSWLFGREETIVVRFREEGRGSRAVAEVVDRDGTARSRAEFGVSELSPPIAMSRSGLVGRVKLLRGGESPELFVSPLMLSLGKGGYGSDRAAVEALEDRHGPLVALAPTWIPIVGDPELALLWREEMRASAELRAQVADDLFHGEGYRDAALRFVVFTETDRAQHLLWPYHEPEAYSPPPPREDVERLKGAIPELYEIVDAFLARVLAERAPGDVVAIVSDHGFRASPERGPLGDHRLEGIFLALGPGVAARFGAGVPDDPGALASVSALDVAPSLLHLAGYPISRRTDGSVRSEIVAGPAQRIRTFDSPEAFRGQSVSIGAEAEAQIRALGYTGGKERKSP